MDNLLKLEQKSNESRAIMLNMLWSIVDETNNSLRRIYDMVSGGNTLMLPEYLKRLDARKPHYRQGIAVNNPYIDILLQRYTLESVLKNIVVDCDVDALPGISVEITLALVTAIEKIFAVIFAKPMNRPVFLKIKLADDGVLISSSCGDEEIFKDFMHF